MKTEIIRRPLFVTLTLLTLVALLLSNATPALADPSPWEQPSPGGGDFDDGTTNGTAVIGGAVQLTYPNGSRTMSADSYDWTHSNTIWDTDHVELNSSLQWVQDIYLTDQVQKTGAGEARVRYIQNIDITGVERVNVRASHRRQGDDVNGDDDNNTHLRVLVGPVELINEYRRSTGWTTYDSGPSGAVYDFVQMYLEGTTWNGNHSIAQNNLLDVDFEKTIYASPGTFMHTYDADHQVDWNTFTPNVTTPSGSSVSYTFWTSDNGSTWIPRSNWPAVQNNPSQYLRVQATLSTSDNLQTPTLNDIDITYNYYQSPGTFTSSTRDPLANGGTEVDDWGTVSWSANLPTGTNIQFQIATSTAGTPNTYVGPDGTAGTYYTNGQAISDFYHANDRYIRYRAYFSVDAAHQASTPRLDDVTITYNQEPQAPTLAGPSGNINDDTPTFQWNAPSDPDGDTDFRYHLQVDNHSDFSSPEVDVTNINALNYTSGLLAQGAHWWRVRARDAVQGAGFSDPYSTWSNVFQITIDSQEPNSWIDTGSLPPAEPEHYGTDANPWPGQIDGGASDPAPATGVNLVEVLVHDMTNGDYWNGSAWVSTEPTNWPNASGTTSWSFPLAATGILTDGHTYEIFSKATDNAQPVGNEETTHGHTWFLYDTTVGFSGRIWNDANGNGVDDGESGIPGVTVNLYDDTPALIASDETDANGDYSFSGPALGLGAGAYTIEVDEADAELDGLTLTSDPDTPLTADYTAGEKVTGLDFGYGPFALIEGYVFDDNGDGGGTARNGVRDGDEPGLADVTVSLGGSSLPAEVTDADGRYRFKGVTAGSYNVNPDENDADVPDYYVATSPDPLAVSDVELGHTYSERNVGYALPPAADKQLYLRYISGRRLSREPGTDTRTFTVGTSHYTWPLISPVIGDVGLDTSQDAIVRVYVPDAGASATMEAEILDGSTSLGSGSVAVSGAGWYNIPVSLTDNTIHDGNMVVLSIYRTSGSDFDIRVDGAGTYRAYVQLPVLSYVEVAELNTYDAAYPGGAETSDFETHDTVYVRVEASDPFGDYDITAASVNIPGVGAFAMTHVGDGVTNDTRIFEYAYVDAAEGIYDPVAVTVDEGTEGTVEANATTSFRVRSADVWVDKSADPTTVQSNDIVTFTLDYGNAGALAAQNVIVTDTLPAGLTYDSMVIGPAPAINGQQLTWNRGTLASGFSGQLVFRATVDVTGAESDTFTNQVEISTSTGEADTSYNMDTEPVTLSQNAHLTIDKDCDAAGHVVDPGDTVMYTILVQNTDYADATGGSIDDAVPEHTTFVGARLDPPTAGTLGAPPNVVTGLTVPGFDGADPGQVTLYYTVTVDSPLANGLGIVNSATVDSAQTDPVTAVHTDTVSSDHNLSVTKWPSDNPAQAGDLLTYTIQYGVTGNEPAPNVVIEDTYPTNSAYVSCSPASCSESGGVATWNLGTLDPVASGVVTLVVQVNSPQPDHTPLENHVEIGDDDGEFAQFDYSGFVGSGHTLALTKSDSPDPVQAGGQIVYTLDYSVSGNENAAGVFITDTVPANATFASCTGGCTGPDVNGVLTWTIGAVNAGSGGSVQFTVDVDDPLPDGAEIYNAAWINDTNGGAPADDDETTTVEADHGYTIVKAVSPDPVEAGATLYYTITWGLSGNEPVSGIFIEDEIPDHTTFSSCGGGVSCGEAGGIVTWQLGDAPSGDGGGVVTFTVAVTSPLQSGLLLHNTATVDDDDGDQAETSNDAATTTHSDHELWITKTDDPDPVDAGALLAYTIDVGVTGDSNGYATGVVITDCVPANTIFHSASGGAEPDGNGCLQWNLGTLAPNATRQVTFTVQVASPLVNETVIYNQAAVFDNEAKYETATAETIVHSDHELNVTKSGAPDPVAAVTGHIDYTINYNVPGSGNEPALGVVISDAIPANTVYVGGSCQPSGICSEAGGVVTWNVGDLVPGNSGTASFRVTVPDPLPNNLPITNTVHVYDLDGEHDEYTEIVRVSSDHSLNIGKSDYPDPVQAGGLITYTISYNVPPGDNEPAPDVIIEDHTPADTTFWAASGGVSIDAPGQGDPGMVRFHLGTLLPGDSGTVQLVVRVDSPLPNNTYIFNSASIGDIDEGTPDAHVDGVTTLVVSDHDLEISKSDAPDPVDAGALINYTIVYTVTGNQSAPNVTIRDTIPPDSTFESCSGGNYCFYNSGIGQVIWGLGRQNPGTGQVLLQVQANAPLPDGTILHNNVEISDDDGRYASYHEETEVSSDHALAISKSDEPDPVEAGGQLVYTLHWQATGNEPAPNVTISDDVPDYTSYVGCSPAPCSESGGTVTWELDTVNSPDEGDVTLTVDVDNLLPDGTLLYNTPIIQDNETPSVFGDEITTTVHSAHQLAVSKADDPDPVDAGAQLDYTIAYTVTGNQYAPNVIVVDTIPDDTTYVAGSCSGALCVEDGGVVTWTLGTLASPDSGTLAFSVDVASPLPNGASLFNFVTISDDDGVTASGYEETIVSSDHELSVAKSDDPDSVQAGELLTYTIDYGPVTGNEAAPNVVIEDTTPAHTTFYTATGGLSIEHPGVGGTGLVRYHLGDLDPGDSGQVLLVVRVDDPLPNNTVLDNSVTISDGDGESADDDETTLVHSAHTFVLEKYDNPDPVAPDQIINYTLHWEVTGNEAAQNIVITDTLPANTSFEGCSGCVLYGTYVRWNLSGAYPPGSEGDESLQMRVDTPLEDGTLIYNTARIRDGNDGTPVQVTIDTTVESDHELHVSKSAPSAIGAGQTMTYTIQYSVSGDEPAPGVVITDAVPAHTVYAGCGPAPCNHTAGVVTWELGDLDPEDYGAVSLAVTVDSPLPDGTEIWNTAHIYDADDGYAEDDTLTTVTSGHGFSLDKRDNGYDPVQAGGQVVYTIDWSVAGTEIAQDVVINDTLPDHTTFAGCGPAPCGESGGVVTWELGNQDPNASGTVTVAVDVASPLPNGTLLTNQAEIGDSNDGLPADDSEVTTVNSDHVLDVEKNGPTTVDAGGQIVYTIEWSVTGNETADDLIVDDVTPVNTTFASASGAAVIDDPGVGNSGLVRYHLGDQLPGASGTLTLVVNVNSPLPDGTMIENTANIADSNGGATDSSEVTTEVESSHAFVLTKSDAPDPVAPNQIINYTIHWEVTGNEQALDVLITDTLPANTSLVNCGDCVVMGGWVYWERGNRNPGSSGDISLQARVDTPLEDGTVIHNVARISDDNGATPVEATADTEVESDHVLHVTKNAPSAIEAGQYINYTIEWSVSGNEPAPSVTITDAVPANTTYVPGSCQPAGLCSEAGGVVTWGLGDRLPGGSGTAQFTVQVDDPLPDGTEIWNTAHIYDGDDGYAEDTTLTTVTSGHGFSLEKRDDGYDPVEAGGQVVYTIDWSVAGTETADDVIISDALPAHTTFTGCGPAPCNHTAGVVTWDLGDQDPGASGTVTVAVDVASPLPNGTQLVNEAEISDSNGGLPADEDEATTVHSGHVLDVEKNGPATVDAGGQIVYTIEWSVTGNETALDLIIEDSTPDHTTFASAEGPGTIDNPGVGNSGMVRYHLGDQAPGANGTVTLTVNVDSPLDDGTLIHNQANISDDNGGAADSDTANTNVVSSHGFVLTKSDNPDPVSPDGLINYTIHWEVTGNEMAQSVVITDAIPANTTFESCGACVLMGDYVRWELDDRDPGDSGDVFLQVHVAPVLPDGTVVTNTAHVFDGNGGPHGEAQATTTVRSGHVLVLEKSAPGTVGAGGQIVYTLAYEVTGDEVAPNAVISDVVPANTTFNSCQPAGCSETGGVVTWDLGTLDPDESGIVQLTVDVDEPLDNGTPIVNDAYFSDDDEGYAEDSATTIVASEPDLSASTKEVDQANAAPGDHLIYTITLTNDGNMVADASLSDVLPAHTAWVGWVTQPAGAVWDGVDTVSWAGDVAPGVDVTIAYEVQVETVLDDGTVIANLASVDDGVAPAFDIGPAQTTIHSAPDLTTSFKEVDVTSAAPGQELEYTLTIVNVGDMVAHDAEVLDYIPDHSSYVNPSVNASSGFAEYQPLYERVRWTGEVEPGTNVIITFRVLLDFPLDEGTEIVNWATVDDNFHPGATDTNYVVTTISAAPDMSGSSKAVNLTDASPGDELRYTITLVNAGSQTADAHVDDVLPGDVNFASGPVVTGGGIGGYDAGGRRIYWDGQVPPGHTVTIEYYVHVNDPLDDGTLIANDATVDDGYNPPFDTNEVETEVHSAPDLDASTKEVDLGTASPGDRLEYVITLENVGDMNATDVTVVDTLPPAYVTLVAVPPGAVYDGGAGTLTWTGLTVNTDIPVELTFEVDLDDVVPDGTFIVNHVEIDDGFNPGVVEREATTIVGSAPNLSTSTKGVDQADAAPGEYLEYTLTLRNNGNATAVGATVTDELPANVAWDGWVAQNGATYDGGTNSVTWTGNVEPGVDQVIVYRVQIEFPLDDGTEIENEATVDDNFTGHDPFDIGPARTTVHSAPNLETSTKAVDLADANPGDELEYTITLVNSGDMTANDAVVLDEIPAYATYVAPSAGSTSGSVGYQAAYNRIRWTGEVEPGTDVVITYRVEVDFPLNNGTVIENFATVDDGIHSPFDTNTVATTIHAEPNLSTSTKVVDLGDAVPGQVLHYQITLVNSGNMVALATVQDVLPPEVSHAGGPTVLNGPPASWDPIARRIYWSGQVAPGTNVVIEYYVTVNSPLDNGTLIENTATLDDDFPGHDPFDVGPAQTTIHSAPDLGASMKEVDRAVAPPGELIEYTITLENGGNMDAAAVLMTDTLPVEVDFVSGPIVIGGGTASYDPVERQVRWSGPVNVDEPVTIRYTVRLDAGLAGGIVVANTATVNDGQGNVFEIGPAETYVGHELGIRLTDGRDTVQPGERITYTLAFSGTEPLNSGLARIEIPDNTSLVTFSPGGEDKGIHVDWDIIGLPPGFYEERFIVVELDPVLDNGLVISTTAHVAGDGQGNQDSESVTVVSSPDLSVSTKQASADTAYAGDTLVYTIVLNNGGTMNGYTVAMTDTIPQYTSYVPGSVSGGSYDPLAQAITWAGPLNAGDQVTITFSVVITELEFIPGGEHISNVAIVDDGFAGHAALEIEAETHLFNGARPDRYKVYLPLVFRNHAPSVNLPDLVVTDISVTPASPLAGQEVEIAVTVENQGTRAPESCFWIDLYINPTDLPIEINQGWFDAGSEAGLVWSLCELDPGESLTLTIDDAREEYSSFAGSFGAPGVQTIYAQIDSWNPGVAYGAVYESNEENNVYGPHQVTVTGAGGAVGADGVRATSEPPPPRPNIPSH